MNELNWTVDTSSSAEMNSSEYGDDFLELQKMIIYFQNFSSMVALIAKTVISTLLIIGLIGNSTVLYISTTTERIINHPIQSALVMNIAIADTVYLLSSAPYYISQFSTPEWIYGSFLCPTMHFLNLITMCVSIFTMCSMASIRFASLSKPFEYHNSFFTYSNNTARVIMIVLIWTLALFLTLPSAIFYRQEQVVFPGQPPDAEPRYSCIWSGGDESKRSFTVSVLVLAYVVPSLLISILYFFIGKKLIGFMPTNDSMHRAERMDYRNTTKLILILVVVFLVCWFPYNFYLFLYTVLGAEEAIKNRSGKILLELVGFCCSYAHACINPVIYTFGVSSFQRSLKKTIKMPLWLRKFRKWRVREVIRRRSSSVLIFSRRKKSALGNISTTFLSPLNSIETPSDERESFDNIQRQREMQSLEPSNNNGGIEMDRISEVSIQTQRNSEEV